MRFAYPAYNIDKGAKMMEQQGKAEVVIADVLAALQVGNTQHAAALSDALIVHLAATAAPAHDVADAYHLRGMARRELGRFSEALEDMRYAAELDAGNAMLWLHIGQIEQRMGELVSALDSFSSCYRAQSKRWKRHGFVWCRRRRRNTIGRLLIRLVSDCLHCRG